MTGAVTQQSAAQGDVTAGAVQRRGMERDRAAIQSIQIRRQQDGSARGLDSGRGLQIDVTPGDEGNVTGIGEQRYAGRLTDVTAGPGQDVRPGKRAGQVGAQGHVAAINRDGTGDIDDRAKRDGRGVRGLPDRQPGEGRGESVVRSDGRGEGSAGGFDGDRARPGETRSRRRVVLAVDNTSRGDRGRSRVTRPAGQRERIGAGLGQRAGAADGLSESKVVGTIENQRGVIDDRSADDARGPAGADLERTRADGRRARESVCAAEGEPERAELRQAEAVAAVGDHPAHRDVGLIIPGGDGAVAGQSDVAGESDRTGATTDPTVGMEHAELGAIGLLPPETRAQFEGAGDGRGANDEKLTAGKHAYQRRT